MEEILTPSEVDKGKRVYRYIRCPEFRGSGNKVRKRRMVSWGSGSGARGLPP